MFAAFGEAWAGVSAATARVAQKLALTIMLKNCARTREPLPAWRASAMAVCEGKLLTEYALLSGDAAVTIGDIREGSPREITVSRADADLAVRTSPPVPGTLEFDRLALAKHLDEFAEQANYWGYDAAQIVRFADEVDPPIPLRPWREVAAELGMGVTA